MVGAVTLRDVIDDDLPLFFAHQMDPEANRMAAFPAREREAFMAHWRKILADETGIEKTILCDGLVAGNIVSYLQDGEREVGYWVGREFWGQGIATRALADFLKQVRQRPLSAHVAKGNPASCRVLEKCGFVRVGEDRWARDDGVIEEYLYQLSAAAGDESP